MPVFSQYGTGANTVKTVAGLPERWGRRAYARLRALLDQAGRMAERHRAMIQRGKASSAELEKLAARGAEAREQYQQLADLIDAITAGPVPVDATDAQLCVMAERFAGDCLTVPMVEAQPVDPASDNWPNIGPRVPGVPVVDVRARMESICRVRGIEPPDLDDDAAAMARMADAKWWRKQLRRTHGRRLEHAAMRLGFVSVRAGSYCSDETVRRRRNQVARNTASLKATMLRNLDTGQQISLADVAAKGMSNPVNRKGELMLRMAGCEAIAKAYEHVGLFVTLTCPSKYHAVLEKTGTENPKYEGARPDQAQGYLNGVWARTRAQNARDGIAPYGFRIAEPHHDGCPHWHMLVFMPRGQVERFMRNLEVYACAEDAYELAGNWPARQARLKIIEIDPAKGSAAGYIAKYVGKNIDDSNGEAFDEEGAANLGEIVDQASTPCQRVDAWSSVWGIRQFQGLGMPPVSVWRELRRVKEDYQDAPDYIKRALTASRRLDLVGPTMAGAALVKPADFAEYIRAQGGINIGRDYMIRMAVRGGLTPGRYGVTVREVPAGVVSVESWGTLYRSTRYEWTSAGSCQAGRKAGVCESGANAPRSPLNNCTEYRDSGPDTGPCRETWFSPGFADPVELAQMADFEDAEWFDSEDFARSYIEPGDLVDLVDDAVAVALDMWNRSDALHTERMAEKNEKFRAREAARAAAVAAIHAARHSARAN